MKTNPILTIFIILLAVMAPLSCGEEYPWATQSDCNNCISPKPTESSLIIDLSNPKKRIPIRVFKGKYNPKMDFDETSLIYKDTATISPYYVDVPVNEYYSVVAEYSKDGTIYKVVDGSELRAYSIKSTCNEDCWIIKGGIMNCQIKF
jgi:hypothetical protein